MENDQTPAATTGKPRRTPWNKGKLVGAKPPLRPSHVWSIRTKLQMGGKKPYALTYHLFRQEPATPWRFFEVAS